LANEGQGFSVPIDRFAVLREAIPSPGMASFDLGLKRFTPGSMGVTNFSENVAL
jgi:hypothetical protein